MEVYQLKLEAIETNKKFAKIVSENASLKDEIKSLSEQLDRKNLVVVDCEQLKQELEEVKNKFSQNLKIIEEKEDIIKEKDGVIEKKEKECYEIQNKLAEAEKIIKEKSDEIIMVQKELEETNSTHETIVKGLEDEIAQLQKEGEEKEETINKINEEKRALEEHSLLEESTRTNLKEENILLNSIINAMKTTKINNNTTTDQPNQEKEQNKDTVYKTNQNIEKINEVNIDLQNKVLELENYIKQKDEDINQIKQLIEQERKSMAEKSQNDEETIDNLTKENQRLKNYIEQTPINQKSQETSTKELPPLNKESSSANGIDDIPIEPEIISVDIPIHHYFTGYQEEIEINGQIFTVPITVGLSDGAEFNYKGYGTPVNGRKRDLIIVTNTQQTESYQRQENNLFQSVAIPQAYRNQMFQCSIPCIDGDTIPVMITGQEGVQGPYEGYGMPIGTTGKRGDLYLIIKFN
ncbi:GRIP domain-containing protein RUD3, putative [Entamoeba dispar SAW760]|uniref:GRIP domain-containing protein RUD3, putative n=1 Tax=Entamoeba dispar (strain ATCC PRA-260 / SAW760) TaxID=370354 RepID=B0EJD9_ENTDS|nr:GRIP domain-containing protein RUD3, putative [Entamoeba dispar SAW760]EDR25376.1 GRIP domain-containing protein RUD3, putative [Entamoeba dispar SAW760]|eukprot:EDR25376.1 GRIP domain-containing protein RUD3, putative [Entamoeba dispar SAW760]